MTFSLAIIPILVLRFLGDVLAVVVGVAIWDRWLRKS
jgi:hypothetical protein